MLSRRANKDDLIPEMIRFKHPNHNYRHDVAKEIFTYKFCNVLAENKVYVCRFLNYSDAIKFEFLCTETRRKLAKTFKKHLIRIGHLDSILRSKLWRHQINLPDTIPKIRQLFNYDILSPNLYL